MIEYNDIEFPLSIDEVPAEQWFEYETIGRRISSMGAEITNAEYVYLTAMQVQAIMPTVPSTIPFGLGRFSDMKPTSFFTSARGNVKPRELTVFNLFEHILYLLVQHKPDLNNIEYQGDTYTITPLLAGGGKEFTAQEVVEALVLEAQFEDYFKEATKDDFDYTQIAPVNFDLDIAKVALLLRKQTADGIEKLPHTEKGITAFVSERAAHLRDLPYSVILSVRFFFQMALTMRSMQAKMAHTSTTGQA